LSHCVLPVLPCGLFIPHAYLVVTVLQCLLFCLCTVPWPLAPCPVGARLPPPPRTFTTVASLPCLPCGSVYATCCTRYLHAWVTCTGSHLCSALDCAAAVRYGAAAAPSAFAVACDAASVLGLLTCLLRGCALEDWLAATRGCAYCSAAIVTLRDPLSQDILVLFWCAPVLLLHCLCLPFYLVWCCCCPEHHMHPCLCPLTHPTFPACTSAPASSRCCAYRLADCLRLFGCSGGSLVADVGGCKLRTLWTAVRLA